MTSKTWASGWSTSTSGAVALMSTGAATTGCGNLTAESPESSGTATDAVTVVATATTIKMIHDFIAGNSRGKGGHPAGSTHAKKTR